LTERSAMDGGGGMGGGRELLAFALPTLPPIGYKLEIPTPRLGL